MAFSGLTLTLPRCAMAIAASASSTRFFGGPLRCGEPAWAPACLAAACRPGAGLAAEAAEGREAAGAAAAGPVPGLAAVFAAPVLDLAGGVLVLRSVMAGSFSRKARK